jgi:hypothetical protein
VTAAACLVPAVVPSSSKSRSRNRQGSGSRRRLARPVPPRRCVMQGGRGERCTTSPTHCPCCACCRDPSSLPGSWTARQARGKSRTGPAPCAAQRCRLCRAIPTAHASPLAPFSLSRTHHHALTSRILSCRACPSCSSHPVSPCRPRMFHTGIHPSVLPLLQPSLLQWSLAVPVLAVSAATDWADGYAARHLDQPSVIGSYLDPLADKVLICSVIAALGWSVSGLPGWQRRLAGCAVRRDVLGWLGGQVLCWAGGCVGPGWQTTAFG